MEIELEAAWNQARVPGDNVAMLRINNNPFLINLQQEKPFLKLLLESMLGDQFWTRSIGTKWEVRELPNETCLDCGKEPKLCENLKKPTPPPTEFREDGSVTRRPASDWLFNLTTKTGE